MRCRHPLLGTVLTMLPDKGPHAYARYNSYYRSAVRGRSPDLAAGRGPTGGSQDHAERVHRPEPVPLRDQP